MWKPTCFFRERVYNRTGKGNGGQIARPYRRVRAENEGGQ